MSALSPVLDRLDKHLDDSLERLFSLLRIQSISTDPAYAAECRKAAEWLVDDLEDDRLRRQRAQHTRPSDGRGASSGPSP